MTKTHDYETELKKRLFPKPDVGENPYIKIDAAELKRTRRFRYVCLSLIPLLVVSSFVYRSSRLWGLADIEAPLNVNEYMAYHPKDEENAFHYYDQALSVFKRPAEYNLPSDLIGSAVQSKFVFSASKLPQYDDWKKWIDDNRSSLAIWKRGAACDEALQIDANAKNRSYNYNLSGQLGEVTWAVIGKAQLL